jgi:CRP-like cAMP-binding protein
MTKPTAQDFAMLKKTVDAVYQLPDEDWIAFSDCWFKISVGKNQTLTVAGNIEAYLYFVVEGVQRIFFLDDKKDREATLIFTYSPSFGGVIDSLLSQQPSRYYYETLSPSVLLVIPQDKFLALTNKSPALNKFVTKALTISLSGVLEGMMERQLFTSEEKFRKLLQRSPHILQLVPQKYLANYIGIDATNFSKLMNTVKI